MDPESESSLLRLDAAAAAAADVNSVSVSYNDSGGGGVALTLRGDYFHGRAALAVFLGLLCLLTTGMNLLVLYAVRRDKSLHTVGNLYIVSLSVADLIVGASVMPLNLVYVLEDGWRLGRAACQLWLIADYVASTASIFSLFILCVDRYRSVRQPLRYLKYRTRGRASAMISAAWLLSLMWIIPILGWRSFFAASPPSPVDPEGAEEEEGSAACDTDFRSVTWFKVATAVFNFYVPSVLMLWFYAHIYRAVRRHLRDRRRIAHPPASAHAPSPGGGDNNRTSPKAAGKARRCSLDEYTPDRTYRLQVAHGRLNAASKSGGRAGGGGAECRRASPLAAATTTKQQPWISRKDDDEKTEKRPAGSETPPSGPSPSSSSSAPGDVVLPNVSDVRRIASTSLCDDNNHSGRPLPWGGEEEEGEEGVGDDGDDAMDADNGVTLRRTWRRLVHRSRRRVQSVRLHKEQHKAAKQLGVIIATFLMCWIPYFVAFTVTAFCQECVRHDLHMFTIWLGYVNSTLNPFIYPLCNDNFKRVFKSILHIPGRRPRRASLRGTTWGRR